MSRDHLRRFASAGFFGMRLGALTVTAEEAVAAARAFGEELDANLNGSLRYQACDPPTSKMPWRTNTKV
jgi:hypothetical protein